MATPEAESPLVPKHPYHRSKSHANDELQSFRSCLQLMCINHESNSWRALLSYSLFILLAIFVPTFSHFVLAYSPQPFDALVHLSLSVAAALAFLNLSRLTRHHGLHRLLFIHKLPLETPRVCHEYTIELTRSFRLLACFVLPNSVAYSLYKIWWYWAGSGRVPVFGNPVLSDVVACALEVVSWVYRMGMFFLVCVLFRVICQLQILRLQDFAAVFRDEEEVAVVLREHLRIRRQLRVISHRFRSFIVVGLLVVTVSQFWALLLTTRPHAKVNLFNGGELALCSIGLVTGLLICLRSAAKITHKAQALTSHAAKWHVCATIDSYEPDPETPSTATYIQAIAVQLVGDEYSDGEDTGVEDELEDTKLLQPHANTISFQKRQALVTYLENNRAGITVFGFVLDRAWLHTIFMIQLSLVLWLLGKTIGIS